MQVSGRDCAVCTEAVITAGVADGCAACDLVFHHRCIETATTCPRCSKDFAATEREDDALVERVHESAMRSLRNSTVAILAAMLAFDVLIALFAFTSDINGENEKAAFLGNLVVSAALAFATYRRRAWARVIYGLFASLSGAVVIATGLMGPSRRAALLIGLGALRAIPAAMLLLGSKPRAWTRS